MLDLLTNPDAWIAFATLTALEIVLGIDNVVFISVLVSRLEPARGARVRQLGLALGGLRSGHGVLRSRFDRSPARPRLCRRRGAPRPPLWWRPRRRG